MLNLGNEDKDVESLLDTCIKEVGTMSLIFRVGNNYIRHTPYLRYSIAYDHDFWDTGTGVKWGEGGGGRGGVKGQKMAQNDIKILSNSVSQELYFI